ncbi:cyclopropane-fatty-acyl-phospholipid synthase family protein [Acidovorax sp. GBBC 3334]|uniref:SAM-dependent methyltransferase n=1 Tax=Acidovorax sp. GBBC 3334 TaxID=2940496 RepID=UPI0023048D2D|nr:cyclopropane-fatty-acyl-phospholipid synthase family protein [Acidovorax sp. GBBC 3334]MDA8457122.1 cyclopropane-fatty-acyl-phospholipid synthase family protein [Acidovorax sp. GBBC 3334]
MTPSSPSSANAAHGMASGHPAHPPHAPTADIAWPYRPLARLLRRLLDTMACGSLVIELPGGAQWAGSGPESGPHAVLVLHAWKPVWRLLTGGDLGLAEGYRRGEWSSPDVAALLETGIRNEARWSRAIDAGWPVRWASRLLHLRRANTRSGSRRNIAFHYDMGNAFYAQWLDASMLYSSAIYASDTETLEEAQARKLARILECLAPRPGDHVLEIGCGWGALALAVAQQGRAQVTGLTLSAEQLRFAQDRVRQAGLAAQVDLRLQDYRDVQGTFDHIVSIEMLEAVGERYWPTYFATLRERLRPGGRAVVQVITIDDGHFEHYRAGADFIQRYIFPGGMLPSPSVLSEQASRAGLRIASSETFGDSYATTLAEWRQRFLRAWPAIEPLGFDAPFRRLWEYYLCYCEAGFRTGRIDVGLYTLTHA